MRTLTGRSARSRRGGVLVLATVLTLTVASLALGMLAAATARAREQGSAKEQLAAQYVAEAGVARALVDLRAGGGGTFGSVQNPVPLGGNGFWTTVTPMATGCVEVVSTGASGKARTSVAVLLAADVEALWQHGVFGDEELSMDSNAHVDSYDSEDGSYEDQAVNGSGADTWANANGNVGSNSNISLSSNATVYGASQPGPSSVTTIDGNAEVTGGTTPVDEPVVLPDIIVPTLTSLGDLTVSGVVDHGSGDHAYDTFVLEANSELHIVGPATFVVQTFVLGSGSEIVVDADLGPVEFFVLEDFVIHSNTTIASTTFEPSDIAFNLLTDNVVDPGLDVDLDEVDFDSNAEMYATIYAPYTQVEINSNFNLFGALIARRVHLDSNAYVHFDEALMSLGTTDTATYHVQGWRRALQSD